MSSGAGIETEGQALRRFAALLWLVLCGLLAFNFIQYARYAAAAIGYKFELNYGEGIVWQQAKLMLTDRMYGDINTYPYIVFHYPPLYHLSVRAASLLGASSLQAGRCISVLATMALSGFVALLVFGGARPASVRARVMAACIASLLVFTWIPLVAWSVLMRVDMLALAFSYGGLVLSLRAYRSERLLYPAVLLFVAAVFTKQTSIAPPISVLCVWLVHDRKAAIRAFAAGLAFGVAGLAALEIDTDGGFLRHIVLYNLNRFDPIRALHEIRTWGGAYSLYVAALLGAIVMCWRQNRSTAWLPAQVSIDRIRSEPETFFITLMTIYLAIASAMLVLSGKIGAGPNYLMEWMCAATIWIGLLSARSLDMLVAVRPTGRALNPALAGLLVPVMLIGQVYPIPGVITAARAQAFSVAGTALKQALLARFDDTSKPVLSDEMVLTMLSGKDVPLEPAIFAELASQKMWDETKLIGLLDKRVFAFVLTAGGPEDRVFQERYLPATREAILKDYPHVERFGEFRLRSP